MEKEEQKDQKDQKEKTTKRVLAGVGAAIALGAIIAIPTAIVLTRDQDVKITIDVGTSTPEVLKVKKGTLLSTIEQPVKEGYTFEGWYSSEDFLERLPDDTIIVENMTIYALMVPNEITFTYYVDNEQNTATVNNGTTIGQLESPTKEGGYEFVGWYLDENFENVADENTVITTSTELYAKFEQATVTLYDNDGMQYGETLLPDENGLVVLPTNTITTEIDDEDEDVTLYFQGWVEEGVDTTNSDFTIYKPYDEITLTSSMRLKAYYAEDDLESYGITSMTGTLINNEWSITTILPCSDKVEIPVLYKGKLVTMLGSDFGSSFAIFGFFDYEIGTTTECILQAFVTTLIIPKSINYISESAFSGNSAGVVEIYDLSANQLVNSSIAPYTEAIYHSLDEESKIVTIEGIYYFENADGSLIACGIANRTTSVPSSITFDEKTVKINECSFMNSFFGSITIPESVTSIANDAFNYLTGLYNYHKATVTIDSATIANGLTSEEACGYIISYAGIVYIKEGLDVSNSTYLTSNYTAETSDVDGYIKYVKNN